ncbi:CotS family spore coat protein [uncultured Clostridium sp.]|uniref:CotS family spore coat protein n=1 Tax=uncultured Clostridium sp. TaxID=59620 RepID=UPI002601D71B|nr:CotS family spore coat protein [uncultured Clostridium sp.]
MEEIYLKDIIEREYGIEVRELKKIKNTYRINGDEGYCLKIINYNYPHFYFILNCIRHLKNQKLESILEIMVNKNEKDYIKIGEKYAYMTRWVKSSISDFDNIELIEKIGMEVSNMHIKSRGYSILEKSKPRIYWGTWIKVFETRIKEIYDFQNRINQKAYKSRFDRLYLENIKKEIEEGKEAIKLLEKSSYLKIMHEKVNEMGFCHHDLENHNILVDENNKIKFIDFDYCILDSNLHDIASLVWRVNRYSKGDVDIKTKKLLNGYEKNLKISDEEKEIMKGFLKFPNDFWQRGLQVYWEQQPWEEEILVGKLEEYLKIKDRKNIVIESI